jgi:cyclic-di-AMP phosphodiesterase PgpH
MSANSPARKRSDRVANLQVDSFWNGWWDRLTQRAAMIRVILAIAFAAIITVAIQGWNPPFAYRQGYIPPRAIVARVYFEMLDNNKTATLRSLAAREVICLYENRPQQIAQLRGAVKEQALRLRGPEKFDALSVAKLETLDQFLPSQRAESSISPQDALAAIQSVLAEDGQIEKFDSAIRRVLLPFEETGLLKNLSHAIEGGNQRFIKVFTTGQEQDAIEVETSRVRIAEVSASIGESLTKEFRREFNTPDAEVVGGLVWNFLQPRLPETLMFRPDLTELARRQKELSVVPAKFTYFPSKTTMVPAGVPIKQDDIQVLRAEYAAWIQQQSLAEILIRLAAYTGMIMALYLLCGLFIHYQFDRSLLTDTWKLARILGLASICLLLCTVTAKDPWRAEVAPFVIFAATATIAYGRSITLVLLTALALAVTLSLGMDLAEFVILMSAGASTTLLLGRIRTRNRLIKVTAIAAIVTGFTTIGVGVMVGQINGITNEIEAVSVVDLMQTGSGSSYWDNWTFLRQLGQEAFRNSLATVLAGMLMTGLLPYVESIFEVQTDLSLLELGDASHKLLRQLAQRAPGTYNHSINVAAIAESAADSIGAHGLLVRVGAYFHDIGKMFKPTYFIENQAQGANLHDSLQPAMSTLVIIAHVKDGADLARQHHLPKPFIDFIEQHHGTTLVEYFYRKEAKKTENDPNAEEVPESTFRYPGPKPQTIEAAILMLADAVESAARTLVEPTPNRLQNLIDTITMKRLTDGQLDECSITLAQLNTVKHSLLKSLTAIYHGRIKYEQQTA